LSGAPPRASRAAFAVGADIQSPGLGSQAEEESPGLTVTA